MREVGRTYGVRIPCYGHAGDGNMHTRVLMDPDWPIERWEKTLPDILDALYALTARLGGKISGEHGIGHKRKPYMPLFVDPPALESMKAIKWALDPNGVLNPGKLFDL
jgi:glycolate oxidase